MAARRLDTPVGLHITSNGEGGEAVLGQIVMVNEALAALPEDEREFEIAHEIGHIDLKHLDRMIDIFRHYVGTITDDHLIARTLNAHIDELSPELQGLEFEADAYGQALLQRIPGAVEGGIHTFQRNVFRRGDYSHPASRERMLKLQASLDTPRVAQAH
jgi:predicted metal-dependent peptidase